VAQGLGIIGTAQTVSAPLAPNVYPAYLAFWVVPADSLKGVVQVDFYRSTSPDGLDWTLPALVYSGDNNMGFYFVDSNLDPNTQYQYSCVYVYTDASQTGQGGNTSAGPAQLIVTTSINLDNLAATAYSVGLVTAGVFRGVEFQTSANFPRVQMDPSGIWAAHSAPTATFIQDLESQNFSAIAALPSVPSFYLDAVGGNAFFSGTVIGSTIIGSTIIGGTIETSPYAGTATTAVTLSSLYGLTLPVTANTNNFNGGTTETIAWQDYAGSTGTVAYLSSGINTTGSGFVNGTGTRWAEMAVAAGSAGTAGNWSGVVAALNNSIPTDSSVYINVPNYTRTLLRGDGSSDFVTFNGYSNWKLFYEAPAYSIPAGSDVSFGSGYGAGFGPNYLPTGDCTGFASQYTVWGRGSGLTFVLHNFWGGGSAYGNLFLTWDAFS
jgi:hypothetical protein